MKRSNRATGFFFPAARAVFRSRANASLLMDFVENFALQKRGGAFGCRCVVREAILPCASAAR